MTNKGIIITDTHCGVRGDHPAFHDNMKMFYDNVMFPYMEQHRIKKFIHDGDLLDKQQYTKTYSANRLREDLLEPLDDLGVLSIFNVGNHDVPNKNTIKINAQQELIGRRYKNLHVVDSILDFEGNTLIVPWICKDNYDQTMTTLQNTKAKYLIGHLQFTGFAMHRGHIMTEGLDPDLFKKFEVIISGHYHQRSRKGNIHYIGAAGEYDWSDYGCDRGFAVFDFDTGKIEYVNNPYPMFHKIEFSGDIKKIDFEQYRSKIVTVYIKDNPSQLKITNFLEKLQAVNPVDVQVAEEEFGLILEDNETSVENEDGIVTTEVAVEVETTVNMIKRTIDSVDVEVDKAALLSVMTGLYNDALRLEK